MAASYDFVQLDVFTQTPLAGNPLAVFTDARGLTDKQMQGLAHEMNLSETTFILPREPEVEATNGKRVRIFTTREELPFAGHPTLGTALYLYSTTDTASDEIVLDLRKSDCRNFVVRFHASRNVVRVLFRVRCFFAEATPKVSRAGGVTGMLKRAGNFGKIRLATRNGCPTKEREKNSDTDEWRAGFQKECYCCYRQLR